MNSKTLCHLSLAATGLLLLNACSAPTPQEEVVRRAEAVNRIPSRSTPVNDAARLLAGLDGGDKAYGVIRNSSAWMAHRHQMTRLWRHYELTRGTKVRAWAAAEFPDLQRYRSAFYPFSGPDFLYVQDLYPQASTYILCGLEPAETLPDLSSLSPGEVAVGLNGLRTTLNTIIDAGYFVTKDMRTDLQSTRFRGTLPVLLATLARSGAQVESVESIQLDSSGTPQVVQGQGSGLLIRYKPLSGSSKRLFYFRQDLSNSGTPANGAFLTFVAKEGTPPALVKSASYLMHGSSFSNIRNYLLTSTPGFVQDPSGVPYRDIVSAGLSLNLYGGYENTLGIFSQQQPDLRAAYSSGQHPVKPVNFGFGYLYRPATTCIMVVRRR